MENKNEIVFNLPDKEYHASTRISKHALDEFTASPYAFFARRVAGTHVEEQNEAFDLGTAVHAAILEPTRYAREFVVQPDHIKVRRGNAWIAFQAENEGKTIIKPEHADFVRGAKEALSRNAHATKLLEASPIREATFFWEHKDFPGIELKSRIDFASKNGRVIGDLKTAASANPTDFAKACDEYGYDVQAAFYIDAARQCGMHAEMFAFIVVEKTFPFTPWVYTVDADSDFVRAGRLEYRRRLKHFAEVSKMDPATEPLNFIESGIALPAWSRRLKALREAPAEELQAVINA